MQKRIDLANQTFGRLTVISFFGSSSNGNALWLCQCQCGNKCIVGQECQWSGQKLFRSNEATWLFLIIHASLGLLPVLNFVLM